MKTNNEKINEIIERNEGKYEDVEIYEVVNKNNHILFHTDNLIDNDIEDYNNYTVVDYELMDEEEYNNTILANGDIEADFEGWYGSKDAHVLAIIIK